MYKKTLLFLFGLVLAALFLHVVAGQSPSAIGRYLLAQVGLNASAPPNQFNILAQQLKNKERTLAEKEQALQEEAALLQEKALQEARTTRHLLIGGGALLALILLNFYMDWRRRKATEKIKVYKEADMNKTKEVFRIY